MQIVERTTLKNPKLLRRAEKEAILQCFGTSRRPTTAQKKMAARILDKLTANAVKWLQCDCLSTHPPLMAVVKNGRDPAQRHLRRIVGPTRSAHHSTCRLNLDTKNKKSVIRSYARAESNQFLFHPPFSSQPQQVSNNSSSTSAGGLSRSGARSEERTPLARLLFRLLDDAGLNRIPSSGRLPTLAKAFERIQHHAKALSLRGGPAIADILLTDLSKMADFPAEIASAFPWSMGPSRPHGFALFIASKIPSLTSAVSGGRTHNLFDDNRAFGEAGKRQRPPYIVIATYAEPEPGAPSQLVQSYAHPCFTRAHLFPVDSRYEQSTLEILTDIQRQHPFEITKPLHSLRAIQPLAQHEVILPDFILKREKKRTIVVETMGSRSRAYADRKQGIHAIMAAKIGVVICHDTFLYKDSVDQKKQADTKFRKALLAALEAS